ncbi:MAG: hypothetical protein JXR46_13780 [Calditrichaceae bacterium]|nr:hypothetical protein [Calditrichaceae bacterium]MBN2710106.1 hypothetical protein [Calditrichaceae bacterium]RQV93444.1 MAG: hypothetical protein EH224_12570 [Calditrichota bacterium]
MNKKIVFEIANVHCYCGMKPEEIPKSVEIGGTVHEVKKIIDRWYEGSETAGKPVFNYFKVELENGVIILLRYNTRHEVWSLKRL